MENLNKISKAKLFVISGPSGVGKGTVIKAFLGRNPDFSFSVSTTTRKIRPGEVHGVNYFYVSKEDFELSVKNDEFLEWAEFSGNYYGTKKDIVNNCLAQNKNLILEIEIQGAAQVKSKMPEAVSIFIVPPSLEDLETRLRNRNTESEEDIQKRLATMKVEMQMTDKFDYQLINDELSVAVSNLEKIIKSEIEN